MLLFHDHNDVLQLLDPDQFAPSCAAADSAQVLFLQLLKLDSKYLAADAIEMTDGRRPIVWSFEISTWRGLLLQEIMKKASQGVQPPPLPLLLKLLAAL